MSGLAGSLGASDSGQSPLTPTETSRDASGASSTPLQRRGSFLNGLPVVIANTSPRPLPHPPPIHIESSSDTPNFTPTTPYSPSAYPSRPLSPSIAYSSLVGKTSTTSPSSTNAPVSPSSTGEMQILSLDDMIEALSPVKNEQYQENINAAITLILNIVDKSPKFNFNIVKDNPNNNSRISEKDYKNLNMLGFYELSKEKLGEDTIFLLVPSQFLQGLIEVDRPSSSSSSSLPPPSPSSSSLTPSSPGKTSAAKRIKQFFSSSKSKEEPLQPGIYLILINPRLQEPMSNSLNNSIQAYDPTGILRTFTSLTTSFSMATIKNSEGVRITIVRIPEEKIQQRLQKSLNFTCHFLLSKKDEADRKEIERAFEKLTNLIKDVVGIIFDYWARNLPHESPPETSSSLSSSSLQSSSLPTPPISSSSLPSSSLQSSSLSSSPSSLPSTSLSSSPSNPLSIPPPLHKDEEKGQGS